MLAVASLPHRPPAVSRLFSAALPLPILKKNGQRAPCLHLVDLHVLEVAGLVVDADLGCRDPGGELTALPARRHQTGDEIAIVFGREPLVLLLLPVGVAQ